MAPSSSPSGTKAPPAELERHFQGLARRVHRRLALRTGLAGLAVGAVLGAGAAAALHLLRFGAARPWVAGGFALLGLLAGLVQARRRRWTDREVALFLDARLDSAEVITTAIELGPTNDFAPAGVEVARAAAERVLARADRKLAKPKLWSKAQLVIPVAVAAAVGVCLSPLPPLPASAQPPGSDRVKLSKLAGLDKIEALEHLGGATPEERERLRKIAEQARKLRAELAKGIERREALAAIAKLRDDIAAERMKFGDAANRAALDAAVAELERKNALKKAARALSEGDLIAFDEEMQRIANLAEKEDRDVAKHALEEAAKVARQKGSEALAKALERERRKLEEAEAKAEALRELARQLGEGLDQEGQRALKEYGESGSPEAQRKLTESLERALRGLSEEERRRLAENLKKRAGESGGQTPPMTAAELEELARRLSEKDADKRLEERLRELARREPGEDARREQGLGDADRGGAAAERGLGALPLPGQQAPGSGKGSAGQKKSDPVDQNGSGGPGGKKDEGTGNHEGESKPGNGKELRSKANAELLPGGSMHGTTLGRAPARAGETANQRGAGALGGVGRTEVGAVEGTDIPEEYREQVGRYFDQ